MHLCDHYNDLVKLKYVFEASFVVRETKIIKITNNKYKTRDLLQRVQSTRQKIIINLPSTQYKNSSGRLELLHMR